MRTIGIIPARMASSRFPGKPLAAIHGVPMLVPQMLDDVMAPLQADPSIMVANLMAPLKTREDHEDPNEVKVVVDLKSFALYFSREPIPSIKKGGVNIPIMRQICLIPFRRDFLITFNNLTPTPLEIIESVDMMRLLEHGHKVKMVPTQSDSYSVDTPEDLSRVEQMMAGDSLVSQYV